MTTELDIGPSSHAAQVFAALRRRKNVLVKGTTGNREDSAANRGGRMV